MLAKIVSTVDVLSSGRALLGVGAGWSQTEFEGYSQWDDVRTRVDKTREGLQLILDLWHEKAVDFEGRYYHAKGAVLDPKPLQRPHPPLIFGGVGPRMLKMAGRHADICFIPPWIQIPFPTAKEIVLQEARRSRRQSKLEFAMGTPRSPDKFDLKEVEKSVAAAAREGCLYYLAPFPHQEFQENIKRFAKEIIPSYTGLQ